MDRKAVENQIWEDFQSLPVNVKRNVLIRLITVVGQSNLIHEDVVRETSFPEYCFMIWMRIATALRLRGDSKTGLIPTCQLSAVMQAFPDWEPDERTLEVHGRKMNCAPEEVINKISEKMNSEENMRWRLMKMMGNRSVGKNE